MEANHRLVEVDDSPDGFFAVLQASFISHRRGRERWVGLEQLGLRVAGLPSRDPALIKMLALKFRMAWGRKVRTAAGLTSGSPCRLGARFPPWPDALCPTLTYLPQARRDGPGAVNLFG